MRRRGGEIEPARPRREMVACISLPFQVDGPRKLDYSFHKPMFTRAPLFRFALWGILSLWVFFGYLELAELLDVVPRDAAEDQAHQDLDEDALIQLASGLKSDVTSVATPACTFVTGEIAALTCSPSVRTVRHFRRPMRHGPSSLRRHQELSVYRI